MERISILCLRELREYASSSFYPLFIGIFSFVMGWIFFHFILASKEWNEHSVLMNVLGPLFGNMNFVFMIMAPFLTMKSFSEEFKHKTFDLLCLSKLTYTEMILGKWLALFTVILVMLCLSLVFPLTLGLAGFSDWGIVFSSYGGLLLSCGLYLMVGLFASSLTSHQVVSALTSFLILFFLMILVLTANISENVFVSQILSFISTPFHFEPFSRGMIRSYDTVYYLSAYFLFYYLTLRHLCRALDHSS